VHRDLKPANVFAARSGGVVTWKIVDFGVAKRSGPDATITAGHFVGTPGYMAPEQARGEDVDHRADVYALGVMAYRMLTGRPVVTPAATPAMLIEVCFRVPPRPLELPLDVQLVLALALAKDPASRFASAGELARCLAAAAAGELPPEVRARATEHLARFPWGASLDGDPSTQA
jgi:serine/threonine-protein kinase